MATPNGQPPPLASTEQQQQQQQPAASTDNDDPNAKDKAERKSIVPRGKKELKILMLHGFVQSGPRFSAKTKALAKALTKNLGSPPLNLHPTLIYPSGPHNLRAGDVPGFVPSSSSSNPNPDEEGEGEEEEEESDNWGWFRKDEATGLYRGLEAGMSSLAAVISSHGGVDGVIGFSQGAAVAALLASALDPSRQIPSPSSSSPPSPSSSSEQPADFSWVSELRAANGSRPLRFAVLYSGFFAPPDGLTWLYEDPPISTPTLHFLGSLDTVVEEDRSRRLIERCRDPTVIVHPGGHYVPVAKDWLMPLIGWLRARCEEKQKEDVGGQQQHMGGSSL